MEIRMGDKLEVALEKWLEVKEKHRAELLIKFPNDPPNDVCHYALFKGMSIENSFGPSVREFNFLFETEHESIYIWTHKQDKNSVIIVDVKESVKELNPWKNLLSVVSLALSYTDAFEQGISSEDLFEYKWIYYFNKQETNIEEAVLYDTSELDQKFITDGRIVKATLLADLAPEIELFLRDDRAYTSVSMLYSSFKIHYICLICELSSHPWHDHLSDEPKIWEHTNFIPSMELAIIQACISVESILGEPPNKSKLSSVLRHRAKWEELIGINPDDIFEKSDKSYLDFYYDLFFELRNPSAHSYGNIHFDLERSKAVQAQCFAALIVRGYVWKHILKDDEARNVLHFNQNLLNRVQENISTSITKK